MKYEMQIRIPEDYNAIPLKKVWKSVKASNSTVPYRYETKEEAERMLHICYGGAIPKEDMRIIEA